MPFQILHDLCALCMADIHLIHKYESRNMIMLQQLPNRFRMGLYAIQCIDDHHCIVQHLKHPLHFCGEIHMSRCIQQGNACILPVKDCLLGINRDTAILFLCIIIQKGISMVHPSQLTNTPGHIQQTFRQRCFAGIHMCQHSDIYIVHHFTSFIVSSVKHHVLLFFLSCSFHYKSSEEKRKEFCQLPDRWGVIRL